MQDTSSPLKNSVLSPKVQPEPAAREPSPNSQAPETPEALLVLIPQAIHSYSFTIRPRCAKNVRKPTNVRTGQKRKGRLQGPCVKIY